MEKIYDDKQGFNRYFWASKWTWISIVATLLIWLYAIAIDNTLKATSPHAVAQAIVPDLLKFSFVYDLFLNIGTAILISRIISGFIGYEENKSRDETFDRYLSKQQDFYDLRIKEVAQSSFRGVYQSRFPNELIDEVLHVGFDARVIRENLSLVYKLRNAETPELGMVVEAIAEYDVVNISTQEVEHKVAIIIPNPIQKELKKICCILQYRKNYEIQDIENSERDVELQKQLNQTNIKVDLDVLKLSPSERCHVLLVYTMAKEIEDTELMRPGTPAKGIKITIHDETQGAPLWIDAAAVHRCKLKDVSPPNDRRVKEYRLSEFFLPNQGFVWFWKRRDFGGGTDFTLQPERSEQPKEKNEEKGV